MGVNAMLDEARTIESDAELVRPKRAAFTEGRTRAKPRQNKLVAEKLEIPLTREIILRLIELLKQA
jgi:hypothetical protein